MAPPWGGTGEGRLTQNKRKEKIGPVLTVVVLAFQTSLVMRGRAHTRHARGDNRRC